jgi:predicted ATPase
VVISAATQRLVLGQFALRNLGPQVLKGVSAPNEVFQVVGESSAAATRDVAGKDRLTPLVGREEEVGLLLARWEQTDEGQGQVVVLSGEPGIGKSRLVQVLKDRVADTHHYRLECRCSPYYANSPLYPVIDLLPRALEWSRDDSADTKLAKLEKGLSVYPVSLADVVPLLASLLSLPPSDRYPLPPMSPERQKGKTLEAILAVLLAMAAARPTLFIIEDLHWVDPTTLEFLTLLMNQAPTARVLTLLTARPTFDPPWTPRAHLTSLTLNRFPRRQTELMVNRVTAGKALPAAVAEQIVGKTDGVPLFVEELTKMVLESGLLHEQDDRYELTGPLPPLAIPSTLQDSLMARLDRLAAVKEVTQVGATLGRTFSYEVLRAVTSQDEPTLQHELRRLVEAELLFQRGIPPQATYTFKHALVQEAAYETLLKSTRQQYHQRIARVLVERFPDIAETRPEFIAHHFTEAGIGNEAVGFWQRAASRAFQRSAPTEAMAHCTKGLQVIPSLAEGPERTLHELGLQITLGLAWQHTRGWSSPENERAFARAHELCREIGETPHLVPALVGLTAFHIVRGELRAARELAERLEVLGQRTSDTNVLVEAHLQGGITSLYHGDLVRAQRHLTEGRGIYDPSQHERLTFVYGSNVLVSTLSFLSVVRWTLGYPDQAHDASQEMLTLARQVAHPFSSAWALTIAAWHRLQWKEWHAAQEQAEAAIALSAEQKFPFWSAVASAYRAFALVNQGQWEEPLRMYLQAMAAYRAMGAELRVTTLCSFLADAYRQMGRAEDGLQMVTEGFRVANKNDEHIVEAELHRLRGELLLIQDAPDELQASECFRQALALSHQQQARSLELRAAMSLARLLWKQGRTAEARATVQSVYNWFAEGFDTADLMDATALLDEMAVG